MRQCFDAVAAAPTRILELEGYGLPQLQTNPRTRFVRSHNQSMPTWDEPKRMRNIKVHGLDFMYGARRYSPEVLQDFKATGAGWQTCMIQYVSVKRC